MPYDTLFYKHKDEIVDLALRYAKADPKDEAIRQEAFSLLEFMGSLLQPKTIWKPFTIKPLSTDAEEENTVFLENTDFFLPGKLASNVLKDSHTAVFMAATLGSSFEFYLRQFSVRDMRKALLWDSLGSAAIETVLDELQQTILEKYENEYMTDRFSCGYGDLPLELQPEFGEILNMNSIGIQVLPSLLMVPSKSVSAVCGLSKNRQPAKVRGCGFCSMNQNCQYRKKGTHFYD